MRKKGTVLILVLMMGVIFTLGSLGADAEQRYKQFKGVTLHIFANSHAPMLKANQWSIDQVKKKMGINIVLDEASYGVQFDKAMSNFIAHTGAYDVIVMAHQWTGGWADAGYIYPLDEFIEKDTTFDPSIYIPKAYFINSTWKAKQVGLPFNMEGRLVFYRKDVFAKEGLTVPTNSEEWLDILEYFHNNPDYPGFYGGVYMYGREQGPAYPIETYWELFDWSKVKTTNGFWDANFQNIMDEKALIEALHFWLDVRKYFPAGVEAYNLPETYEFFMDGKAAMTEVWPLTLYGMLLERPDFMSKVGTMVPPTGKPFSGGWAIGICTDSKQKEAAWEYIKFMTSPENDLMFSLKYGKGPSVINTYSAPETVKIYGKDMLKVQLKGIEEAVCCGKIPTMSEFYGGDFWILLSRCQVGELTPEKAAPAVIKEMSGILERSGYKQRK